MQTNRLFRIPFASVVVCGVILLQGCYASMGPYYGEGHIDTSTPEAYCSLEAEKAAMRYQDNEVAGASVGAVLGAVAGGVIGHQTGNANELLDSSPLMYKSDHRLIPLSCLVHLRAL